MLDNGLYVFGVDQTMRELESGRVKTLLVWENLDIMRYQVKENGEIKIFYGKLDNVMVGTEKMSLIDWLVENSKSFGTQVFLISNRSQEG